MGWASGSSLLRDVWEDVRFYIAEDAREDVLLDLMYRFAARDCDTLAEVICDEWPESAAAYARYCEPDADDDEEESDESDNGDEDS